jgi:hypothetical protein
MMVSGFTFMRNAITFDYPNVEAIQSILPLCDEVVVAVGNSDDDTLAMIRTIDSNRIRIIETVWDDTLDQRSIKDRLKHFFYEKLSIELGYKNYLAVRFRTT